MRRINPKDFRVATRTTSREINRRIALSLVKEHQPISRADLARLMEVRRGVVSVLVNELIAEGLIYEGATGETARGRKPTFLYVRTQDRLVVAVDIRFSRTYLMLSDFGGRQMAIEIFETIFSPQEMIEDLAARIKRTLAVQGCGLSCEGIGVAVPGMIDYKTGRISNAPALGWRNVDIKEDLAARTGLPVQIENAAKACALARMWQSREHASSQNFVYIGVSDGVGVGVISNGELVRGHDNIAGEFGHTPLSIDGPRCVCGATGCWEAYISNIATLSRYFGRDLSKTGPRAVFEAGGDAFTIGDLVARARSGDAKAIAAIQATGRYMGLGLATVLHAVNPDRVCIGGEITAGWDLIGGTVREALAERALTDAIAATPIDVMESGQYPRLQGAAALIAAPVFAAPRVA